MKRLVFLLCILLSGCVTTDTPPAVMKFPDIPQDLKTSCPDLQLVDANTEKLSDVLPVIVSNYGTYYNCKVKVDAWIEWYNTQKNISDNVK